MRIKISKSYFAMKSHYLKSKSIQLMEDIDIKYIQQLVLYDIKLNKMDTTTH